MNVYFCDLISFSKRNPREKIMVLVEYGGPFKGVPTWVEFGSKEKNMIKDRRIFDSTSFSWGKGNGALYSGTTFRLWIYRRPTIINNINLNIVVYNGDSEFNFPNIETLLSSTFQGRNVFARNYILQPHFSY
jgi:hypothetical protein